MDRVRDEAARGLFDWVEEYYRRSGNLMGLGIGNANDPWAAIRIPSGSVGLLKMQRIVAIDGVDDRHTAIHWTLDVDWGENYTHYVERDDIVWTNLTTLPMFEDAPRLMEKRSAGR